MPENKIITYIKSFREGTLILIIVALSILMSLLTSSFFDNWKYSSNSIEFCN